MGYPGMTTYLVDFPKSTNLQQYRTNVDCSPGLMHDIESAYILLFNPIRNKLYLSPKYKSHAQFNPASADRFGKNAHPKPATLDSKTLKTPKPSTRHC